MRSQWFSLVSVINYKTIIVTAISVAATFHCIHNNITAKFPDLLIGMAIIFPVVFSISSAFSRREFALQRYSEFKGHLVCIFLAVKDWPIERNSQGEKQIINTREEIRDILRLLSKMFMNKKEWKRHERDMYQHFRNLSLFISDLRKLNVQSGEISRANQYVSKVIIAFDSIRTIYLYRTPVALRLFSKIFIYSFPLLYAPYFAAISKDFNILLTYAMPVLYSFILISLNNIQDQLENPFDKKGADDIIINVEEETAMLL